MSWVYKQENRIYTIILSKVKKKLEKKYPDINFTQDPEPDDTSTHFPSVYIHFLPSAEKGQTINSLGINAIYSTIQVNVTSSKTQGQTVAREVTWEVVDQLHSLQYEIMNSPEIIPTGNDTNQCVCRMRRMLGANDTLG